VPPTSQPIDAQQIFLMRDLITPFIYFNSYLSCLLVNLLSVPSGNTRQRHRRLSMNNSQASEILRSGFGAWLGFV
jgi:hypothetical protein